jgi:hypothetical protein
MGVPAVIFVLCLSGGAVAGARFLPDLEAGPLGGLTFFAVCGLFGLALALLGEHIYLIVREVEDLGPGVTKGEALGAGLRNIAVDEGTVLGLAFIAYLLAPRIDKHAQLDEEP